MKHWYQPDKWGEWRGHVWSTNGHVWSTNGHVAYRDGDKSGEERGAVAAMLDREDKAIVRPVGVSYELHGYLVMTDGTMVCAHFIRRAESLFPGVEWTHGDALGPFLGRVGGELVAVVMPNRMTPGQAEKSPGYPKCPTCDGSGKNECANCEGSGEVECEHCGNETECEECDGEGYVGTCAECGGDGRWRE